MKSALVTGPTVEPVLPQDLIDHSRIDAHEEDAFLLKLLEEGREAVEEINWSKLIDQTWDQSFDAFTDPMILDYGPVDSITSVTYVDENSASQTLGTSIYELGEKDGIGIVRRKYNQNWPACRNHADDITVRYKVGYGTAGSDVPAQLKSAIRLHAAHYWIHREGAMELPQNFYDLIRDYSFKRHR